MASQPEVFLTGATGFIGGRILERLFLEHKANVRVLVRDLSKAARVARFPVRMIKGRLTDQAIIDGAIRGCDSVIHCAHDQSSPRQNLQGTATIIRACIKHQIRRMVHISTISVYEPLPDGPLNENARSEKCGQGYADTKIEMEELVRDAVQRSNLQAVILQPSIVYGAHCKAWIDQPAHRLLTGKVVLPNNLSGLCNLVYVDDVVNACLLSMSAEGIVGERFLISADQPVPWEDYFRTLERALGTRSLIFKSDSDIQKNRHNLGKSLINILKEPNRIAKYLVQNRLLRPKLLSLYENLPDSLRDSFLQFYHYESISSGKTYYPTAAELQTYRKRTHIEIDKAKKNLGYQPRFSFPEGMHLTAEYLRWRFGIQQ